MKKFAVLLISLLLLCSMACAESVGGMEGQYVDLPKLNLRVFLPSGFQMMDTSEEDYTGYALYSENDALIVSIDIMEIEEVTDIPGLTAYYTEFYESDTEVVFQAEATNIGGMEALLTKLQTTYTDDDGSTVTSAEMDLYIHLDGARWICVTASPILSEQSANTASVIINSLLPM